MGDVGGKKTKNQKPNKKQRTKNTHSQHLLYNKYNNKTTIVGFLEGFIGCSSLGKAGRKTAVGLPRGGGVYTVPGKVGFAFSFSFFKKRVDCRSFWTVLIDKISQLAPP